jgi:hypothetical protein
MHRQRLLGVVQNQSGETTMMIGDEAYAVMAQRHREANAYRASRRAKQARAARQIRNEKVVSLRIRRLTITVARQEI